MAQVQSIITKINFTGLSISYLCVQIINAPLKILHIGGNVHTGMDDVSMLSMLLKYLCMKMDKSKTIKLIMIPGYHD